MGRRASHRAARKKGAKRQRALEKRAERERNRASARYTADPATASHRLALLREAVVRGDAPAPRGLTNLGNTCFFNAVMQNLARVASFREFFVGGAPCPGEGPLTLALRSFCVAMWDLNTTSILNPSKLFTEVGKKNPSFRGRAQQDAHELMRVLFDGVVEEEKQRLSRVYRGILPPAHEREVSDSSSDSGTVASSNSLDEISDECPALEHPSVEFIGPLLPGEFASSNSKSSSSIETSTADSRSHEGTQPSNSESSSPDADEPDEIPAERLLTIIERTFGGTLSSTIICKECGSKSSVTEPFLDLQLPLVPNEEPCDPEPKAKANNIDSDKSEETVTRSGADGKSADSFKFEYSELKQSVVSTAPTAPPPPPPPPPLPPPPRSARATENSGGSSDPMEELRKKVNPYESEPIQENRLIVVPNANLLKPDAGMSSDTEAVVEDDDTDSCCFPSLFDDDFCDSNDTAMEDVKGMSAFSTSEAARAQDDSKRLPEKPSTSVQNTRRPSSFISSFFGGFGASSSAAPYGYKSIIGSLEEFTKIEVLEGENSYGCEECTRREKLRIALRRKRLVTKPLVGKVQKAQQIVPLPIAKTSSNQDPNSTHEERIGTRKALHCKTVSVSLQSSFHVSRDRPASEPVSSPVTSSESSSSVCSDEEGELVVEEELETGRVSTSMRILTLTRDEEEKLLSTVKVDIPTVRTTAEKRFMVREAPNVLAIQLKRFMQTGFRGGLRKISGSVSFPINLDISNFVDTVIEEKDYLENDSSSSAPDVTKRKRMEDDCADTSKSNGYQYVLTGVCVHGGSLSGGHYTAYVREGVESDSRGGWYLCNDSKISRATEKDVLSSEPYLLYYERV